MCANIGPFFEGFGTGAGLIMAIGAQNAYLLKQGILRNHVGILVLLCALIDALLILLGVTGFGELIKTAPLALEIARWGGIIFLLWYGFRSFRAALNPETLHLSGEAHRPSLKECVTTMIALSLLNPHVYLDTVVLLGSISTQTPHEVRPWFAFGAMSASGVWFTLLGFGARLLRPLFQSTMAWRILDVLVGLTLWGIAGVLLFGNS